jgi:hypothetical protein
VGQIYEEAWGDPDSRSRKPQGGRSGRFESIDDLRREIRKLIVEHNLHGIDIDPRAVQIAASPLAAGAEDLKNLGLRPRNGRASPNPTSLPPSRCPAKRTCAVSSPPASSPGCLGQIVDEVFEKMKLAGEAGSLLKIEEEIKDAVAAAGKQWREGRSPSNNSLFARHDGPASEAAGTAF